MLRRWDLVALLALFLVPLAALGATATASRDVSGVVAELDRYLRKLQRTTPPADSLNLDPLKALAPLSESARADIDAVLAGTKPPWELSPSATAELTHYENSIRPLAASLALPTQSRPMTNQEHVGAADLGRSFAFFAINTRSRGLNSMADANCQLGYSLAMKLGAGGGLDEAVVAADIFRTVHGACGESFGTAQRSSRIAALEDVLALSSTTPQVVGILERDRAWRMLRLYRYGIGDVPGALTAHLPSNWQLDPDATTDQAFLSRSRNGLAMRAVLSTSSEAIAREATGRRAPPPELPAPFERTLSFRTAITDARAADELQRSTWRVLAARLVAEIFVIDHQRWPKEVAELHVDDKALDDRVQMLMQPESLSLLEHDAHLSIILDGKYNIRATLPDDLAHLARPLLPARDFTGRLIERAVPREQ